MWPARQGHASWTASSNPRRAGRRRPTLTSWRPVPQARVRGGARKDQWGFRRRGIRWRDPHPLARPRPPGVRPLYYATRMTTRSPRGPGPAGPAECVNRDPPGVRHVRGLHYRVFDNDLSGPLTRTSGRSRPATAELQGRPGVAEAYWTMEDLLTGPSRETLAGATGPSARRRLPAAEIRAGRGFTLSGDGLILGAGCAARSATPARRRSRPSTTTDLRRIERHQGHARVVVSGGARCAWAT